MLGEASICKWTSLNWISLALLRLKLVAACWGFAAHLSLQSLINSFNASYSFWSSRRFSLWVWYVSSTITCCLRSSTLVRSCLASFSRLIKRFMEFSLSCRLMYVWNSLTSSTVRCIFIMVLRMLAVSLFFDFNSSLSVLLVVLTGGFAFNGSTDSFCRSCLFSCIISCSILYRKFWSGTSSKSSSNWSVNVLVSWKFGVSLPLSVNGVSAALILLVVFLLVLKRFSLAVLSKFIRCWSSVLIPWWLVPPNAPSNSGDFLVVFLLLFKRFSLAVFSKFIRFWSSVLIPWLLAPPNAPSNSGFLLFSMLALVLGPVRMIWSIDIGSSP